MDLSNLTVKYFLENKSQCLEAIKSKITEIPTLNNQEPENFKNYTLVRFSGYIQDLLEPEYYLEKYEVKSSDGSTRIENGRYRDSFELNEGESVDHDSENKSLGERRSMFLVELPGLNDWAKDKKDAVRSQLNCTSKKREIDENEMEVDEGCSKKVAADTNAATTSQEQKTTMLSTEYLLNSPIPSRPSPVFMVRVSFQINFQP